MEKSTKSGAPLLDASTSRTGVVSKYNLREFGNLMQTLRARGVGPNSTADGHYPSLCPELRRRSAAWTCGRGPNLAV